MKFSSNPAANRQRWAGIRADELARATRSKLSSTVWIHEFMVCLICFSKVTDGEWSVLFCPKQWSRARGGWFAVWNYFLAIRRIL